MMDSMCAGLKILFPDMLPYRSKLENNFSLSKLFCDVIRPKIMYLHEIVCCQWILMLPNRNY